MRRATLRAICLALTSAFDPGMNPVPPPALVARYFDGASGRAHPVTLQLLGNTLHIHGEGIDRAIAMHDVQWPERTRHGVRVAHFSDGGSVQCSDAAAWDAWCHGSGHTDAWVVRLQQSWRGVMVSVLALMAIAVALQQWGIPLAARTVVARLPLSVDASLGEASLTAIDQHLMRPSKLSTLEQERLRNALTHALTALPTGTLPRWQLVFRQSSIGPNAFALPGGTLVLTDELVALVEGDAQVITAVLAHEMGHVQHRHGVRMLVQATFLGGLGALFLGDFSTLLAGVPVVLGQASYSRQAEREADTEAVRILKAAAISPLVMVTLFDKLAEKAKQTEHGEDRANKQGSWLGIAFASHPADADRVRYFKEAASGPP